MSDITLGNWEIVDDDTNSRLILRSTQTGNEYYLNENGNLEIPSGGGADLQALAGALDAAGNDISNVGSFDATSANIDSLNGGAPLSDGDGTERQIWVIAAGASDPAGADPEDIIFEEA